MGPVHLRHSSLLWNLFKDSANWLNALIYISFFCMESNRQNIQFCPWCIVWSFLRYFFQIGSECDDPYLKTCTLVDRYQVPPSVEIGWSPHFSTILDRKRSATNIFLSFEMLIPRISLFLGSIDSNPQPNVFRAGFDDDSFVENIFFYVLFLWPYPLRLVFLNPVPDRNVISSDKTSKSFRGSS